MQLLKKIILNVQVFFSPKKASPYIEGAIRKWDCIAQGIGVDRGSRNCPLCQAFLTNMQSNPCGLCPVKRHTGYSGCANTPYHGTRLYSAGTIAELVTYGPAMTAWVNSVCDNVEAEIEFLVSLLPEEHPWRNI